VLRASAKGFVSTPFIDRLTQRAFRYLQSGFSVHLQGPAGTGKTTLALHLADLLGRPIMLVFGDDEFKTSDLIGNQNGYTRKKVVDNYIHSVVKLEDEMRHNWVDSRLTMACREGFTLVYDEFNRSRPEVNNVLLSALEEKLLALPPTAQGTEYVRVDSHFRGIFTSNPEEYCGVHATQDALLDRLITINMPEPDELTQQEIAVQKTGLRRDRVQIVVRLVKAFQQTAHSGLSSGLRASLMISKICQEHTIEIEPRNDDFRDVCADILLSRTKLPLSEATPILWQCLDRLDEIASSSFIPVSLVRADQAESRNGAAVTTRNHSEASQPSNGHQAVAGSKTERSLAPGTTSLPGQSQASTGNSNGNGNGNGNSNGSATALKTLSSRPKGVANGSKSADHQSYEQAICNFLKSSHGAHLSEIEAALGISRVQAVDALRSLTEKGILVVQRDDSKPKDTGRTVYRVYAKQEDPPS
jgi:gas vesicle protein GvpN